MVHIYYLLLKSQTKKGSQWYVGERRGVDETKTEDAREGEERQDGKASEVQDWTTERTTDVWKGETKPTGGEQSVTRKTEDV